MMVKRHPALIPLSNEHFSHLIFADRLKKGKPFNKSSNWPPNDKPELQVKRAIEYFSIDILNHFKTEEEIVFALYIRYLSENDSHYELLQNILNQHKIVKQKISELNIGTEDDIRRKIIEIGEFIETHIRTEERKLFEEIQKIIPEVELIKIGPILAERCILKCSNIL